MHHDSRCNDLPKNVYVLEISDITACIVLPSQNFVVYIDIDIKIYAGEPLSQTSFALLPPEAERGYGVPELPSAC